MTDPTSGASFSNSNTNSGWLAGVGIEYGLTPNWTIKVEYDHLGLSSWTVSRSDLLFPGNFCDVVAPDRYGHGRRELQILLVTSRALKTFSANADARVRWSSPGSQTNRRESRERPRNQDTSVRLTFS